MESEYSCYPIITVGGIYAQEDTDGDLIVDADIAHSDLRVNQIIDGNIGFVGMDTTSVFECPPGMECLFPFIQ